VIIKDQEGNVSVRELQGARCGEHPHPRPAAGTNQQHDPRRNDIDGFAAVLANNSAAGLLLIENLWALKTKQAMLDADARLLLFERIPHEVVEENLAEMAAIGA